MYKLQFTLKQHTPIIHFHDQEGSLLRSTEVKQKLDSFLVELLAVDGMFDKDKYSPWLKTSEGKPAFDYSCKIESNNIEKWQIPKDDKSTPFFFGNMGEEYTGSKLKYLIWTETPIKLTLKFKDQHRIDDLTLKENIGSFFAEFLLRYNFGTRQGKGYGSFYLSKEDLNYKTPDAVIKACSEIGVDLCPFKFKLPLNPDINNQREKSAAALKKVELFYKALRSGINKCFGRNRFYLKSIYWCYFKSKIDSKLKWEKKKIKEVGLGQAIDYASTDELAIKDLMGFSPVEKWGALYDATIEKTIEGVDRIPSPIFIKLIANQNGYTVYIHPHEIPKRLLEPTTKVEFKVNKGKSFKMDTPNKLDFWDLFLFIEKEYSLNDNFILDMGQNKVAVSNFNGAVNVHEYRDLSNIISQLKRN